MVVTEPYPASRVGEATPCPLGQSVVAPVGARPATNSRIPFGSGYPSLGATLDRSQSLDNRSTSERMVKRELSIRGRQAANASEADSRAVTRSSRSS